MVLEDGCLPRRKEIGPLPHTILKNKFHVYLKKYKTLLKIYLKENLRDYMYDPEFGDNNEQ